MAFEIWIIIAGAFILLEGLTLGLTSIWFAGGALITAIAAAFTDNLTIQIAVFVVCSGLLLIFAAPKIKNKVNLNINNKNFTFEGKEGIALTDIKPYMSGRVLVDHKDFRAVIDDTAETIKKDEKIIVTKVSGVTLTVKRSK